MGFWGLLGDCIEGIAEFAWDSANAAVRKNAKYRKEHADRMNTEEYDAYVEKEEEFKNKIKQSFAKKLKHSTDCDDLRRKFQEISSYYDYDARTEIIDSIETKRHILQEYDKLKANNSINASVEELLNKLEDNEDLFDLNLYSNMHEYVSDQKKKFDVQEKERLEALERMRVEKEALQKEKAEAVKRKKHDYIVRSIQDSIAKHSYNPMDLEKLLLDNKSLFSKKEMEDIKNSIWENY